MKARLTFDLPEEQGDFNNAVNGFKYKIALWDLDQWLRTQMKYHDHEMSEEVYDVYEMFRNKLHEFMQEYSVNFEDD